ncbi:electron transfer flavoprotein subunit beta/FixA family protein [Shewanella sp. NIFS-20-20]|uniref:electron transfer flavoprotein subunit beta/FixA family protein n=1 Tax=Shewanella sp. NIFS-20-20 TaxID=2853806 RepID=UPI001C463747|nr:electron transfer flavoprotein subunit beta/FixA family protein [Shewanella sp. NIFS-20-20]MBV7317168.1 electron transfer flavoprotein subunit beta/FixA family protein [Shewanella sp. NIFS-20-20]
MKILVPIKRVVDSNVKVRVMSDGSGVDASHLKMAINPFCEIAVEQAVRLKEAGVATEVVVVTVGGKPSQEQIRSAMALGADRGIQVEADDSLLPIDIAKCLAAVQQQEQAQLIILGKQSIDGDNNQTGQMLAALLDLPQACFASDVSISDNQLSVTREIDGGLQSLTMALPAIVTADLRLNEPRYAKLPDIMKAKRKPLDVLTLESIGVTLKSHQHLVSVSAPAVRQAGVMVSSVAELVEKLKHEAKVI